MSKLVQFVIVQGVWPAALEFNAMPECMPHNGQNMPRMLTQLPPLLVAQSVPAIYAAYCC